MKKWLVAGAAVMLGLALVLGGCGPGKPARETVELELYTGGPAGTGSYVQAVIASEMINELHPWLRASVLENMGAVDAIHTADALPPERRKYALIFSAPHSDTKKAVLGETPYKRKFTDLKWVGLSSVVSFTFQTYDPEIKKPQDLIGKRIAIFSKGSAMVTLSDALLKDAWGIYDKVKLSHHSPMDFKDLLLTGVVDVAWSGQVADLVGGKFYTSPYCLQVMGAKQAYWLNVTEEDVERINERNVWKTSRGVIPKGALGGNDPPEEVGGMRLLTDLNCWADAPDEVVYEFVSFIVDYADEWILRTGGRPMSAEFLGNHPGLTEDMFHPGALRYYKEQGVKIGS